MKLSQNINVLAIENDISKKLINNKIKNLKQLTNLKKKELAKKGFSIYEIGQIEIKLQLQGLDLKK